MDDLPWVHIHRFTGLLSPGLQPLIADANEGTVPFQSHLCKIGPEIARVYELVMPDGSAPQALDLRPIALRHRSRPGLSRAPPPELKPNLVVPVRSLGHSLLAPRVMLQGMAWPLMVAGFHTGNARRTLKYASAYHQVSFTAAAPTASIRRTLRIALPLLSTQSGAWANGVLARGRSLLHPISELDGGAN
ncbi:hypothetical protein BDZ91DRAFT_760591 [Kalaharituber pfeilii]|nr:hypothetical protein BDZ91DRAFT_760591 [Kalaharituber pfeilii]